MLSGGEGDDYFDYDGKVEIERIFQTEKTKRKLFCVGGDAAAGVKGYARQRMWAQYGDGHRGFCLVFDRELLDQAIKRIQVANVVHGRVLYSDDAWSEDGAFVFNCSGINFRPLAARNGA